MYKSSLSSLLFLATLFLLISNCKEASDTETKVPVVTSNSNFPDPLRFKDEIARIQDLPFDTSSARIVFTGSSTIRMWKDIQSYYPNHQIINTGFGGSEMSDLFHYLDETILRFAPSKVFIYEGDNDVNSKRPTELIVSQTERVVRSIHEKYPACKIYLISAKPSLARWSLKDRYLELNNAFTDYAKQHPNCEFINIWEVMLDEKGEVLPDIFIEDGLHMNKAGYDLWDGVVEEFVEG